MQQIYTFTSELLNSNEIAHHKFPLYIFHECKRKLFVMIKWNDHRDMFETMQNFKYHDTTLCFVNLEG